MNQSTPVPCLCSMCAVNGEANCPVCRDWGHYGKPESEGQYDQIRLRLWDAIESIRRIQRDSRQYQMIVKSNLDFLEDRLIGKVNSNTLDVRNLRSEMMGVGKKINTKNPETPGKWANNE